MKAQHIVSMLLSILIFSSPFSATADDTSSDQLLKLSYYSSITKKNHQYFVYLPHAYNKEKERQWPVILFLHGHGGFGTFDMAAKYPQRWAAIALVVSNGRST